MASTFLGLNTNLTGLSYFQSALNTTSHNISNANSEGYSRQQVIASASDPLRIDQPYGMMGTGVKASSIERLRNVYYDNKYWTYNARYSNYSAQYDNLSELQTYMNEMGTGAGYTEWISQYNDALQDLANNPSDYTTRISYTLTADSYTDVINELANNFQNTQKSINDEMELAVSEINSLSKQIYELTQQIINIELKGGSANDLRDQRGVCIDTLSEYVNVDVEENSIMYGTGINAVESNAKTMSIRINGEILVDELEYKELVVVPRSQKIAQNDVDGLIDICWKCSDGSAGNEFNVLATEGKLSGLMKVRDGNNNEYINGTVSSHTDNPTTVKINLSNSIDIEKVNLPYQGIITLNGRDYMYDGWSATYDALGKMNDFVFQNLTEYDSKGVIKQAVLPDDLDGYSGSVGTGIITKGIPYYMAQLNEMVRTFSDYMNKLTTSGVDENGDPGLDAFTALDVNGNDFALTGSLSETGGVIKSTDSSYYRLTALNWELNSSWQEDPAKVVVSMEDDVAQGDIEAHPITSSMIFGMTDQNMFSQGTLSQFMQSITTNLAVDISKMEVFSENQDDILYSIDAQRQSVSGVDVNEEAADLVKFQNLYNLASKAISVLNEVYDKLINETGV